ncbi:uncharacterized protein BDR25DRAFT_65842 [Lindgomyces ingoldianus]|uniref:Uncharacterized protein n=1 Tax=Lindgomyces ingoldianus TaxID=673940 RepID=A0ACB6RBE0_9PLEO|nr:uncharacterized protein BDR25DRAFT_65842 [Lindgomyces ingoldianus]KAF2476417.1 hypothetical protein BDR25DRAFT_65842 [Lindgomyces ingoldianus]
MADDDNFDIDIYGDDTSPDYQESNLPTGDVKQEDTSAIQTDSLHDEPAHANGEVKSEGMDQTIKHEPSNDAASGDSHQGNGTQQISSTGGSANNQAQPPKQAPRQQGMKRKQGDDDDRPLDPGASAALLMNDLHWWVNEEDIRGWANQSGCEDEVIDITFNEHKVNGKSKGQVYVQLQSPQAATALKHQLESFYESQTHSKKPTAVFNPPHINPFKTLPKDIPAREKNRGDRSSSGNFSGDRGGGGGNFNRFNNNRGNFNNRGNISNNMGFQNRNFSGPAGGNMGGNIGGYGSPAPINNFGSAPMGGMNNFGGGFNNRGGMMGGGMRGGGMNNRGGRGGGMGMGNIGGGMNMPMGGNMMGMGGGMMGMPGNMGMMGGMGGPGGFGGNQPHFNPAFFNQNQGGDGNWNPHGAKRPRPE